MKKPYKLKLNIQHFATPGTTKLVNLIDPEVMGDMISAQLPDALKFTGIAPVDSTLAGQPGSTIKYPRFKYIGAAEDVAEGEAIQYSKLETDSAEYTIKKAGKGVEITDEAVLSGYGDPVGEAQKQVRMSIAEKVDNDVIAELRKAPLVVNAAIDVNIIDKLESTFTDAPDSYEDTLSTGVLFLNYKDAAALRKAAAGDFTKASDLGDDILIKGAFGEVLGWEIVRTRKLDEGEAVAVKPGALKTLLKRDLLPEAGRDMDRKISKFNADQHYTIAIVDESLIVRVAAPTP